MQATGFQAGVGLRSSRVGQDSGAACGGITEAELTSHPWWFGRLGGAELVGMMRFLPGGAVYRAQHDNESCWSVRDGVLRLENRAGHPTTIFDRGQVMNGRRTMIGSFLFDRTVDHVLAEMDPDALRSLQWLSDPNTPLTVIFNDAGRTISGPETRWNFYRDTVGNPFDHIRYIESGRPHFWYLNKLQRILAQIGHAVESGYREIGFYGSSSGGYASLLLGELVARKFRHCRVRTLTLNPQTAHGPAHEAAARQAGRHLRQEDMPIFILPEVLFMAAVQQVNIRDHALCEGRGNVEHMMFYDSLNPVDSYYAGLVAGLAAFHLVPVPLAAGHAAGIKMMRQHQAHQAAYDWLRFRHQDPAG